MQRCTSLGADDGIAISYGLALLDADVPHPRIELVITTEEEVGMLGSTALDVSSLKGKYLLNIDTGGQGTFIVSSACGTEVHCSLPLNFEKASGTLFSIKLAGLHGGHSGSDIHCGYANAITLTAKYLRGLFSEIPFSLVSFDGGTKCNTIPVSTSVGLLCREEDALRMAEKLCRMEDALKEGLIEADLGLRVTLTKQQVSGLSAITPDSTEKLLTSVCSYPNGLQKMSNTFEGVVESSLNLGTCTIEDGVFKIIFLIRSLVDSGKKEMTEAVFSCTESVGGSAVIASDYPEWEYNPETVLPGIMSEIYRDMTGKEAVVTALHAGLESGVFRKKMPHVDCISFGPDWWYIHSSSEKLSISSAGFIWEFVKEFLRRCK